MTESKDEDEGSDNGWEELVQEKESRVTEKLVQLCHHLRRVWWFKYLGLFDFDFLKRPGRCVLVPSTVGGSNGCEQSPENILDSKLFYVLSWLQTWVNVFSGQKTRFSSGMKTLAPATAAPRTVMTVRRCSTLRTSSSHTVRMIVTASTEPQMKATFLAITVARGLHLRYTLGRGPKMKNGWIDKWEEI